MAIEKFTFTGTGSNPNDAEVLKYFQDNATDYFNKIEYNSGNRAITLSSGSTAKISNLMNNPYPINIVIANGETAAVELNTSVYPNMAVKTTYGILIYYKSGSYNATLIIAKDSNGNTVAIATSYEYKLYPINLILDSKTNYMLCNCIPCNYFTSLCPISTQNSATAIPGVYFTPFRQYSTNDIRILSINGKQYVANNYIALEE